MIHLRDVSYTYPTGVEAIRRLDLDVSVGEALFVLGHNGAGKSTMLRLFNGLLKPTTGAVTVGGANTAGVRPAQLSKTVGLVFQNPDAQLFRERVSEEVSFGAEHGAGSDGAPERFERAMALLGLERVADRNPYDLSLSWRKRVAIASIVAMGSPILVLDEPTGGQDAEGTRVLTDLIMDRRNQGHGCVVVTHDVDLAFDCADRVIVLREGEIYLEGDPMSVLGDPLLPEAGVEPSTMHRVSQGLQLDSSVRTVDELEEHLMRTEEV